MSTDKWFSTIELSLTFEQFLRLPQNRAYKYEYARGRAVLSPRPMTYRALLDLRSFSRPIPEIDALEEVGVRPLADEDWQQLPPLFAAAFHRVQPFSSLAEDVRLQAAEECLQRTKDGAEGPLLREASVVTARKSDGALVGALLTTLVPTGGFPHETDLRGHPPPPADAPARPPGRPHLTWIFVGPWHSGFGIGTAMLDETARALAQLGYTQLASTFLLGNDSSTLWHWRVGFRLQPHPGAMRMIDGPADEEEDQSRPSTLHDLGSLP
jgi:hypothetical protein